ncbi:ABC-2 type transporter-domain-containing protein [Gaertneriomyces semiglobifer]|nr:ABC-2 type transporter-domain-containing protein [Gaertneriomyces semiglobifer]
MENVSQPPQYSNQNGVSSGGFRGNVDAFGELDDKAIMVDDEQFGQEVDVDGGVQEFDRVERELQHMDSADRHERTRSPKRKNSVSTQHLKDQGETEAPPFDLRDFLETSVRFSDEHKLGLRKRMGVVFKHLTVVGEGADASQIGNMWESFVGIGKALNPVSWFRTTSKGTDFDILHDLSGVVKDGEMVLVLGRPGSGCSTFLRVIANERKSYRAVKGVVTYGGVPANQFDRYAGEAIYTAEEDVHYPTLTVKQTLHFALRTKTPSARMPEQSRRNFRQKVVYMLTNMFGLTKQINTLVGNEWVRGLSGGERKRMTITEAMTARAAIGCWDCSTRGLDAASALDYTRGLRIMSNTLKKTTFASFYQASDDMYNLFDKVMVLDRGRCIFFGPVGRAKAYFEQMGFLCPPRKSTPDFLTGITNPNEREYRSDVDQAKIPHTALELEAYFHKSEDYKRLQQDIADYEAEVEKEQPYTEFHESVMRAKSKGTRASTVYTVSFGQQVKALVARELQLMTGDKTAVIGKLILTIIKAFIYAIIYIKLPLNANGAFVRGAALFSSLMFNALMSLSELPNAMRGRRILQKHKSYAMYYPSAYHIATVIADIPGIFLQVLAFSICVYFLEGLRSDAGAFFIFVFTLLLASFCMTEVFRLCGAVSKSYFSASQAANIILIAALVYNGFLVTLDKMHPWFKWISYLNPLFYGHRALLINEMRGLVFPCTGYQAVPFDAPGTNFYTNDLYRTCTMKGQRGPELVVLGQDYIADTYGYTDSQLNISIIANLLFWFLYIILNCLAMEFVDLVEGGYTRQVYKKGKAPKQNDVHEEIKVDSARKDGEEKHDVFASDTSFTWQDVVYTVPVKGGERRLLDHVEGWIKPGEMTALMGSSGAGKTTLLDVLAKRKTIGTVEGKVYLDGKELARDFERITGYVEQMDIHNPGQTVREALRFSAKMRQDPSISVEEKYAYVEKILDMMEMTHLGDALIGDLESGRGISVEERKRLTIGMELVGKPKIMFLDEPTSGLDAQSSYNIIKFLRKLTDNGMPLVCTIHQPSSILFEHFDRLLLLARGGKTVYFGDIGKGSRKMLDYFESNGGRPCSSEENPAEYILQVIGAGTSGGKVEIDWPEVWQHSSLKQNVTAELNQISAKASNMSRNPKEDGNAKEFSTSMLYQMVEVYKRMNVVWWRDTTYNFGRFLNALFVGLFNGFTFYQLGNSSSDLASRIFLVFQLLVLGNSVIILAQPQFMQQRAYFRREYASKFYGFVPFVISIVVTELPYLFVTAAVCFGVCYWTAGMETTAERGFYFFFLLMLYLFFSVSLGQMVAAFSANIVQASIINPFLFSYLVLFCGVLIPPAALPGFLKWAYHSDAYRYLLEGFVTNVLHDVKVVCNSEDLIRFRPPPGQTCGEYLTPFLQYASGYVADPSATDMCGYCQYKNGDEYYAVFGWSFGNRWRNFGIFLCYWIFNIAVAVFFTYLFRKPKRIWLKQLKDRSGLHTKVADAVIKGLEKKNERYQMG